MSVSPRAVTLIISGMSGGLLLLLVSAGALATYVPGQSHQTSTTTQASKAIAYAKQIDVSLLDPTLPKRPLGEWMRDSGAPADTTLWEFHRDCDQMYANADSPSCVDFKIVHGKCADHACAAIWGSIEVGTVSHAVSGKPRFRRMTLLTGAEYNWKGWDNGDSLSELPRLISKLKQY